MGLLRKYLDSIVAQIRKEVNSVSKKCDIKSQKNVGNRRLLIFKARLVDFTCGLWYNIPSK